MGRFRIAVATAILSAACTVSRVPASLTRVIPAPSPDVAMRAAVTAASETNWTTKTVSVETGYLLAEHEVRVSGRANRSDSYKLEVTFSSGDSVTAKVTAPPGTLGTSRLSKMVAEYLDAYDKAVKR